MTPSAIRQAIACALTEAGFCESPLPLDLFGREPRTIAHRAFSVWVRSTATVEARQRRGACVPATTAVSVRYLHALATPDRLASLDEAMDAEREVVEAVMGAALSEVHFEQVPSRSIADEGGQWYLAELRFSVLHTYPL